MFKLNYKILRIILIILIMIILTTIITISFILIEKNKQLKLSEEIKNESIKLFNDISEMDKIEEQINKIREDIKLPKNHEELCIEGTFTAPLQQEIDFNNMIKEDKFVQYLREVFDKVLDDVFVDDDYFNFEDGTEYIEYMKSKFIVLSTDIAPGGGESIVIMFKDKPDKVFYAWVYYEYYNSKEYYDLKGFSEYDLTKPGRPTLKQTQEIAINQLCDENFGI